MVLERILELMEIFIRVIGETVLCKVRELWNMLMVKSTLVNGKMVKSTVKDWKLKLIKIFMREFGKMV